MDVQVQPSSRPTPGLDLDAAGHLLLDRLPDGLGKVRGRRDDFAVGLPDGVLAADFQPALRLRVHVGDAKMPVHGDVAVADGCENIVPPVTGRRMVRVRSLGLVEVGDDTDDFSHGAAVGTSQYRVPASHPPVVAIGTLNAQLLAEDFAFARSLDRREVSAEARQVLWVNKPLKLREPKAMRARRGKPQHLLGPMAQEGDAAPKHMVDIDHVWGSAHDAPQHELCPLLAFPCRVVERHARLLLRSTPSLCQRLPPQGAPRTWHRAARYRSRRERLLVDRKPPVQLDIA